MVKYLPRYLIKEGFAVSVASSGEAALERIKRQHFGVVMLDVLM